MNLEQFIDFYSYISFSIDKDEFFEEYCAGVWRLGLTEKQVQQFNQQQIV